MGDSPCEFKYKTVLSALAAQVNSTNILIVISIFKIKYTLLIVYDKERRICQQFQGLSFGNLLDKQGEEEALVRHQSKFKSEMAPLTIN